MKKANKIIVILLIPVIIIGGGIGSFYLIGFINYAEIEKSYSFYYQSAIRADPEKIRIITQEGTLNIRSNKSSVPYYIKADINLKAEGIYMEGADPSYYFHVDWNNNSFESITELFVMGTPPTLGGFYHPSWTVKYDININITLRTDILYDLYLDVWETDIFISENIFVNDLFLETGVSNIALNANATKINNIEAIGHAGSLTLNLAYCNISDSIYVKSTKGDINFASYNSKCSKNVEWTLIAYEGSINAIIYQSELIGANISGILLTHAGGIKIEYEDKLSTVGAVFNATVLTGSFITTNLGGFEAVEPNSFRSTDFFSAINIFTFTLMNNNGYIKVDGQSS